MIFATISFVGCDRHSGTAPTVESPSSPEPILLTTGTWDDVQTRVNQCRGKVVVLDLWSTSCEPCVRELPQLAKLQQAHSDDIICISLNVDYVGMKSKPPKYYRERVQRVLELCQSHVINYLCTIEADVVFRELNLSSIPAVYVYGAGGQLVQCFDSSLLDENSENEEPFTYQNDVIPLVHKLLAAQE